MLLFASGVFTGWKHETFGQCFLDSVWLIGEELPQSPAGGGGKVVPRRRAWVLPAKFVQVPSRRRDEDALLLIGAV